MASISPGSASRELLALCLNGEPWPDRLLQESLSEDGGRAFFRIVVERLADLFEPALCDTYARLFTRVIELVRPEIRPFELLQRYERIRRPRPCQRHPEAIYVLSRVTLGADVAVTSIVLDGLKKRFPKTSIFFVGSQKNYDLFAADPRISHLEFNYPRAASLTDRLAVAQAALPVSPSSIVVDPDSRLTQLGLLPVCDESQYYFFESRAYGGSSSQSLAALTRQWVVEIFDANDARAYIAPASFGPRADIAVSLGVGENQEKRLPDPFEERLLELLSATGASIILDEGAGGEEQARVRKLADKFPPVTTWSGAYAPFADAISKARLYVGYDSAGQHVAAASGVSLISIFAGYPSDRMFHRWRPTGEGPIEVIKVDDDNIEAVLDRVRGLLQYFTL